MLLKDVLHVLADFGKETGLSHVDLYIRLFDVPDVVKNSLVELP